MAKGSENPFPSALFVESATPATPAAGRARLFVDTNGILKWVDDAGTVTDVRDPSVHASTHQPGGADAMAIDAVAGTGSLRTLGTGAQQAAPGDHQAAPGDASVTRR